MKMEKLTELIKELVMVPGVSGFEEPMRHYLLERLKDFNPKIDDVGNVYVTVGSGDKHIAILAHMDEIGLVITHIEKDGYIRFSPIGGVDNKMLYGRVVEIFTDDGVIYGVIGLIPPHLSTQADKSSTPTWKELAIDVGAKDDEDAKRMGLRPLLPVRWKKDFVVMGKYIVTRGLDDRVGCAVLLSLIERLRDVALDKKITFIFTVQEETGLRGAFAASHRNRYDEVYVVDTMTTGMMPGVAFHLSPVKIGEGPVIRFVDRRGVASQYLRDKIKEIAAKNGIPVQEGITGGSTDAAAVFNAGIKALPICIPVKYTHSPVEMCHIEDIKNAVDLLEKIVKN